MDYACKIQQKLPDNTPKSCHPNLEKLVTFESHFILDYLSKHDTLTSIPPFFFITQRYATVIIRHLANFDARRASFQIQNGGCMRIEIKV